MNLTNKKRKLKKAINLDQKAWYGRNSEIIINELQPFKNEYNFLTKLWNCNKTGIQSCYCLYDLFNELKSDERIVCKILDTPGYKEEDAIFLTYRARNLSLSPRQKVIKRILKLCLRIRSQIDKARLFMNNIITLATYSIFQVKQRYSNSYMRISL